MDSGVLTRARRKCWAAMQSRTRLSRDRHRLSSQVRLLMGRLIWLHMPLTQVTEDSDQVARKNLCHSIKTIDYE